MTMGVWVGFDEKVTLGDKETGGRVALPIWFETMQEIYKDKPVESFHAADVPVVSSSAAGRVPETDAATAAKEVQQ
jgi:penicillin-binding protein 1A